jgi:hypothetical protein
MLITNKPGYRKIAYCFIVLWSSICKSGTEHDTNLALTALAGSYYASAYSLEELMKICPSVSVPKNSQTAERVLRSQIIPYIPKEAAYGITSGAEAKSLKNEARDIYKNLEKIINPSNIGEGKDIICTMFFSYQYGFFMANENSWNLAIRYLAIRYLKPTR